MNLYKVSSENDFILPGQSAWKKWPPGMWPLICNGNLNPKFQSRISCRKITLPLCTICAYSTCKIVMWYMFQRYSTSYVIYAFFIRRCADVRRGVSAYVPLRDPGFESLKTVDVLAFCSLGVFYVIYIHVYLCNGRITNESHGLRTIRTLSTDFWQDLTFTQKILRVSFSRISSVDNLYY